jgi:nucleoporin NDC1
MCYNIIGKGYKCVGKKTNPQPVHSLGPENIRWTNLSTGRKDNGVAIASTQKSGLHKKAYIMAYVVLHAYC